MKKTALCLALASLALAITATAALASSLPQFKDPTFKVKGKPSIGGVTIGMAEAKAIAAWGAGRGKCETGTAGTYCEYGSLDGAGGYAVLSTTGGKVNAAQIFAGKNAAKRCDPSKVPGAFRKVKTSEGVGLGTKLGELEKIYPDGAVAALEGPPEQFSVGTGKNMVTFALSQNKVCGFGIHA